jgi:phosphoesterase RecJ-like protein
VLSQVVELIENKNNFAITTHVRPDGDGVGSSLGLCWLLRSLGKQAEVLVRDGIPVAYRNLPGADEIREIAEIDREYDAVFRPSNARTIDRPCIKGLEKAIPPSTSIIIQTSETFRDDKLDRRDRLRLSAR